MSFSSRNDRREKKKRARNLAESVLSHRHPVAVVCTCCSRLMRGRCRGETASQNLFVGLAGADRPEGLMGLIGARARRVKAGSSHTTVIRARSAGSNEGKEGQMSEYPAWSQTRGRRGRRGRKRRDIFQAASKRSVSQVKRGEVREIIPGCASRDRHRLRPFAGPAELHGAGVRHQGPRTGLASPSSPRMLMGLGSAPAPLLRTGTCSSAFVDGSEQRHFLLQLGWKDRGPISERTPRRWRLENLKDGHSCPASLP